MLQELTFGDLLYSFLLSGRSTKQFYKLARERAIYRHRRKVALERLVENNYVRRIGNRLSITSAGQNALGSTALNTFRLLKTRKWDQKWRIAIFDIPEKYAPIRNKVRGILKTAGFLKLQHSVWVFPHECEELVSLIKRESRLSQYILYGVLERIEDEGRLKKLFHLLT
jgi:DNA-binding transcriptional regulator PaaX